MKVIKNNMGILKLNAIYPKRITCAYCGSELEYIKDDVKIGAFGAGYIECPVCKESNIIEDGSEDIILTKDNIEFSKHFVENNGKDNYTHIDTDLIREYINKAINYFKYNENEYIYSFENNGYFIFIERTNDDSYDIIVTENYYFTNISVPD